MTEPDGTSGVPAVWYFLEEIGRQRLSIGRVMAVTMPFLTSYDPPGSSEGTLDPLGLYQIADQLAVQLVPAVRERMQRIRFLTAMAVGALVTEDLQENPEFRDASPFLVWEWLVVESLIRSFKDDGSVWGVPGTLVTKRALEQHGYLDARSYLKTARIFGFHGVYKRLAVHLGLVDVHLRPARNTEPLVDAWTRNLGFGGLSDVKPLLDRWKTAVQRSLSQRPPCTKKSNWTGDDWENLASSFAPSGCGGQERRYLRNLLLTTDERKLGALPVLWKLQTEFGEEGLREEVLHGRLQEEEPAYGILIEAIRAYEAFARSLQDAFDVLKAEAANGDSHGYSVQAIAHDSDFRQSVQGLHQRFEAARKSLAEVTSTSIPLETLFSERFVRFSEPLEAAACAIALCSHHEEIQRKKSAEGKRPWFDRLGGDRIYIRHSYRQPRREIQPGRYVHDYRGWPIRRFYQDLRQR